MVTRADALVALIEETRLLFHRLAASADALHAELAITAAQRGVLEYLAREGPAAVPQVARDRGVSRQHIQVLVNGLVEAGLLEATENPAHLRSPILALSTRGAARFAELQAAEAVVLERLAARLRLAELTQAGETLAAVRRHLDALDEG